MTYIDGPFGKNAGEPMSWQDHTWDRLAWIYGADRADNITTGKDPKTSADLRAWRQLGRKEAA